MRTKQLFTVALAVLMGISTLARPAPSADKPHGSPATPALETYSFIYSPLMRPGLSTFDLANMKKNEDGGVTLYFGPKAPQGLESNWIPTAGKKPFPVMRFYGGTDKFWDKSWKMPDVELVK